MSIELTVTAYTADGQGIGRTDEGEVVFVAGAVRGDVVRARLVHHAKTYWIGQIEQIIKSSPYRVEPQCRAFPDCGGCALLHLSPDEQRYFKKQLVIDAAERIAGLSIPLEDVRCFSPVHYRNKAQIPVSKTPSGIACGFYKRNTHEVIDCPDCLLSAPFVNDIAATLKTFMRDFDIAPYDEAEDSGIVRHLYVRCGMTSMEVMVSLVTRRPLPHADEWVRRLLALPIAPYHIESIMENRNEKKGNTVLGKNSTVLFGRDHIFDTLLSHRYKISHHSFFQVNPEACAALYQKVIELASLTGTEEVFDLYCGIGTISLSLAPYAKRVTGVEIVAPAIDDAKQNAALNHIENARFLCGEAEKIVPKLYKNGEHADVVVVDPPRKGCEASLLETIAHMDPDRLIYVSCNPATMARDLKKLVTLGFTPASPITPFDQFPGTAHVETVILMSKKEE